MDVHARAIETSTYVALFDAVSDFAFSSRKGERASEGARDAYIIQAQLPRPELRNIGFSGRGRSRRA